MRKQFINTLIECAKKDPKVALLMAEVGFSVVEPFEKEFPERFFNTGIAEQNLVLSAAGMAMSGMHPIAYSMSSFLPSRAFEMIKISVCYQNLPVVLVTTGTGLSYGEMGSTHHAIEESAIMRSLPNLSVEFPCDGNELSQVLEYALSVEKPFYISFPKAPAPTALNDKYSFGKAVKCRDGEDVSIIAVGFAVHNALEAAEILKKKGISASVYGFHTVKPIDEKAIADACKTKNVFVVDEHQVCGGFGSEVAKIILKSGLKIDKFSEIGVPDCFVDNVARYNELQSMYGLSAEGIFNAIYKEIKKE